MTAAANVTTAHDLSPISAALTAYALTIANGTRERGFRMQDVTAEMAKKTKQKNRNDMVHRDAVPLAGCYGQIGISAVVAAARYQGSAKNPAYAPTSNQWHERLAEAAA